MRKNIWLLMFLILIIIMLLARCATMQFMNDQIGRAPLEIPPFPKRTVELVDLYFGNGENQFLKKEQRAIERTIESREEVILKELISGPRDLDLVPTIPYQTRLFSVSTVAGVSYVNFSKEFVTNFIGGERAEVNTIYSVVNSLTELRHVNRVQILVEGERLEIFQNSLSLREPYTRNERILKAPFPSPIEVLRAYLNHIEKEEYRYAYDLIYRPGAFNLDYSIYFRYMRENKNNTVNYTIMSYRIIRNDEGATILLDYIEDFKDGKKKVHEGVEFKLRNDFGEWRIVFDEF